MDDRFNSRCKRWRNLSFLFGDFTFYTSVLGWVVEPPGTCWGLLTQKCTILGAQLNLNKLLLPLINFRVLYLLCWCLLTHLIIIFLHTFPKSILIIISIFWNFNFIWLYYFLWSLSSNRIFYLKLMKSMSENWLIFQEMS